MKRIMACLLVIACLLSAVVVAAGESMKVIKVKQAVNLRKGPSTDTASLAMVPLGTIVTDCVKEGQWYSVNYNGTVGYIRGDFLEAVVTSDSAPAAAEPAAPAAAEGTPLVAEGTPLVAEGTPLNQGGEAAPAAAPADEAPESINAPTQYDDDYVIMDATAGDVRVIARQIYQSANEYLMVVGLDASGNELWKKETTSDSITELEQTNAFIGGTQAAPLVLMYNACKGLTAIDPATGAEAWTLDKKKVDLGGSISYAVDANGVAYIGGYYGPDPVAIDANGNVLWQASSGKEGATWMYRMELLADGVACAYGSMASEHSGTIVYDFNGAVKNVIYD